MSVKQKNQPEKAEYVRRDTHMGIKIVALLSRKSLSQTALGRKYGVTMEAINQTIWGVRKGKRLRACIAYELGYESWEKLKKASVKL